jgi:hypothetical protein
VGQSILKCGPGSRATVPGVRPGAVSRTPKGERVLPPTNLSDLLERLTAAAIHPDITAFRFVVGAMIAYRCGPPLLLGLLMLRHL